MFGPFAAGVNEPIGDFQRRGGLRLRIRRVGGDLSQSCQLLCSHFDGQSMRLCNAKWVAPALTLLVLGVVTLVSCGGDAPRIGTVVFEGPIARPSRPTESPPSSADAFVAFDAQRRVVVVDPATGSILDSEGGEATPGLWPQDVALDRERGRAYVFDADRRDQYGLITEVRFDDWQVAQVSGQEHGGRIERGWVDGRARLWPSDHGVVVFQQGYGDRWRLLRDDGMPTPSSPGTPPAAGWMDDEGWLSAYGFVGDSLERTWVFADDGQLDVQQEQLWLQGYDPDRTQVLPGGCLGDALVVEANPHGLSVQVLMNGIAAAPDEHPTVLIGPVVAAALIGDGCGEAAARIALLSYDRVTVVDLAGAVASLPLETELELEPMMTRRILGWTPQRFFVATIAGVFAIDIGSSAAPLELRWDADFEGHALRGPIAGPL